jgi:hypothetical protein
MGQSQSGNLPSGSRVLMDFDVTRAEGIPVECREEPSGWDLHPGEEVATVAELEIVVGILADDDFQVSVQDVALALGIGHDDEPDALKARGLAEREEVGVIMNAFLQDIAGMGWFSVELLGEVLATDGCRAELAEVTGCGPGEDADAGSVVPGDGFDGEFGLAVQPEELPPFAR